MAAFAAEEYMSAFSKQGVVCIGQAKCNGISSKRRP